LPSSAADGDSKLVINLVIIKVNRTFQVNNKLLASIRPQLKKSLSRNREKTLQHHA
jgi:hypothetical protein